MDLAAALKRADGYSSFGSQEMTLPKGLCAQRLTYAEKQPWMSGLWNGVSVSSSNLSQLQRWEGGWQAEGLHQQMWAALTHLCGLWHRFPWQRFPHAPEQPCLALSNWSSQPFTNPLRRKVRLQWGQGPMGFTCAFPAQREALGGSCLMIRWQQS